MFVAGDALGGDACLLKQVIKEQAGPRAFLSVDEADAVFGQGLDAVYHPWITRGGDEAEFTAKEVHAHGFCRGQICREGFAGVVLAAFRIEEVTPRQIRQPLLKKPQALRAARNGGEDEEVGQGSFQGSEEQIEDGIVAAGGQEDAPRLGVLFPGRLDSRGSVGRKSLIDERFWEDPFACDSRRRNPSCLDEEVDLLFMDVQIPGNLFRVHQLV